WTWRSSQPLQREQRQHPRLPAAVENELLYGRHDTFHAFQVEAVPCDSLRLVVFRQDLEKAFRIPLRADHPLGFVPLSLLHHLRGLAPGVGHDTFPVALGFFHQPVSVLQGAHHVMERVPQPHWADQRPAAGLPRPTSRSDRHPRAPGGHSWLAPALPPCRRSWCSRWCCAPPRCATRPPPRYGES